MNLILFLIAYINSNYRVDFTSFFSVRLCEGNKSSIYSKSLYTSSPRGSINVLSTCQINLTNIMLIRRRHRSFLRFVTCLHVFLFFFFYQVITVRPLSLKTHLHLTAATSRCRGINHDAWWRWWQAAWVTEAVCLTSRSLGIW